MKLVCALLFSACMLSSLAAQDVNVCNTPDVDFDDSAVLVDTINVIDDIEIDRTKIYVDLEHNFINDVTLVLESPEGTLLTLFDRSGGSADDIIVTFSDEGIEFGADDFDCACEMQIELDSLAELNGEMTGGDWNLEITDNFPGDDGTLNEWCVTAWAPCTVLPPTDVTCTVTDSDVEVTWTEAETYDSVVVFRDNVEIATLTEGETSYTDIGLDLGVYEYSLVANVSAEECGNPSESCQASVALLEFCTSEATTIEDLSDTTSTITVAKGTYPDEEPVEVELSVDLTHDELGQLEMQIEHGGTTLTLYELELFGETQLNVVYSNYGDPLDSESATCECAVLPTAGAQMNDLLDDPAEGDWVLTVSDTEADLTGTLNEWCVTLYDEPTNPDPRFIRGDVDGNGLFSGILDGLYVLQYQFTTGAPEPPCFEAADADNSGSISGLLDGLFVLTAQFIIGAPLPSAPYPDCDVLSDDDLTDLGCETPPDC